VNLSDLLTGAATIYGEARGSTHEDRVAVAHTILNRTKARSWYGRGMEPFPDHSISAVCRKPQQFSCWNLNDPNYPKLAGFIAEPDKATADKSFRGCMRALLDAVDSIEPDPTEGATHYLTTSLHKSGKAPAWSKRDDYIEVGAHRFFTGIK